MSDAEFERRLLDSARGDAPPQDPRSAWARLFSVSSSIRWGARSGATDESGRRGSEATPGPTAAGGAFWPAAARTSRRAAAKWLLLGAIGGSALTAAVMIRSRPRRTDAPAALVSGGSSVSANVAYAPDVPARASLPAIPPAAGYKASSASASTRPRRSGPGRARVRQDPSGSKLSADETAEALAADSSTLAAEVSRIDAARSSSARGDYDQAIQSIERYHRDFPEGALAPDADVVALEAVAAKRDRPETARRAALFLSRYPGDPHTARVKWLAEH
jgi:TolA-binding protein